MKVIRLLTKLISILSAALMDLFNRGKAVLTNFLAMITKEEGEREREEGGREIALGSLSLSGLNTSDKSIKITKLDAIFQTYEA